MNKYLQVARTYYTRSRFMILGAMYLALALGYLPELNERAPLAWLGVSVWMAAVLAGFVGLHVRRQMSGPAAQMLPGFALPHLVVAALVSLLIWMAVPAVQAAMIGTPAWVMIGLHAPAGLVLALVALWPQALFLVVGGLLTTTWLQRETGYKHTFLTAFLMGDKPGFAAAAIGAVAIAHAMAAVALLRLGDQNIEASDDFVIEPPGTREANRAKQWLWTWRDREIEFQTALAGLRWWPIRRWRIPGCASWTELFLLLIGVGVAVAACNLYFSGPEVGMLVAMTVSMVLLFVPFNTWRFRCSSMAGELMRPVTRKTFVRQFMGAMALDFTFWTAMASLVSGAGIVGFTWKERAPIVGMVGGYLITMWLMALALYASGLVAMQFRYWVPLLVGLFSALLVAPMLLVLLVVYLVHGYVPINQAPVLAFHGPLSLAIAAGLIWATYRRWLRADMV